MNIIIRQETEKDYKLSESVVEKAFRAAEYSDHKEQFLVANLRKSDAFVPVPELCLAAELENRSLDRITGTVVYNKAFLE